MNRRREAIWQAVYSEVAALWPAGNPLAGLFIRQSHIYNIA
jgi:hypothetical protein